MAKNKSPKRGRPSADLAGEVQARILDAAQQLFLEKGFRSASIDEISELAPASKPTIYAHFPGKEALFAAVVARTISGLTDFHGKLPQVIAGRTNGQPSCPAQCVGRLLFQCRQLAFHLLFPIRSRFAAAVYRISSACSVK